MESEGDFEVLFKNETAGSLILVIKRKKQSLVKFASSPPSSTKESCSESEENLVDVLTSRRSIGRDNSLIAFYNRPDETYESLIQMAFKDVSEKRRHEGLQAHEIAQWICRKFPYFATIKSLLQCVTNRLTTSKSFEKCKNGKKIWWKWNDKKSSPFETITNQNVNLKHAAAERANRRKRIRKKPNFFSIDWKLNDRKRRKLSRQDFFSQFPALCCNPKCEALETEDEKLKAHLNFLKSSKAIVQPWSPEKPAASQIILKRKKKLDLEQEKLFSYLGLVSNQSDCNTEDFIEDKSKNDNKFSSSSCSVGSASSLKSSFVTSTSTLTEQSEPSEIKMFKNDAISSSRNDVSLKHSSYHFKSSFCKPQQAGNRLNSCLIKLPSLINSDNQSPETCCCYPAKIEKNSNLSFFENFSRIEKQKCCEEPEMSVIDGQKKTNLLLVDQAPFSISRCRNQLDVFGNVGKQKVNIVPGSNGSPLFPTIKSIFSMRKSNTPQPQKTCLSSANSHRLRNTSPSIGSPRNKLHISSPLLAKKFTGQLIGQRNQSHFKQTAVRQIHDCFVTPPVVLYNTKPSRSVSMDNFVQPTWSRNVTQSVMTTTVPEQYVLCHYT